MTVNKSDLVFFEKANKILGASLANAKQPPTIDDLRAAIGQLKQFIPNEQLLPYEKVNIPCKEGQTIKGRFISKDSELKPLLLFFPGTGFMHPMFDENYNVLSRMVKNLDCHGLMVEYRLSPEHPFPCPHEDANGTLNYVLNHLNELNIDKDRIILCGYSSGANVAAVLCNKLQNEPDFKPFHQYLLSGGYDYTDSLHDFDDYANQDKMLDKEGKKLSFDMYCQDANRKDPLCSPYWQNELSNLCPTTIQCGEYDGGRSQSEGYFQKLDNAGVPVEKIIVPGQSHLAIVYRGMCSDGEDPALVAANKINSLLQSM